MTYLYNWTDIKLKSKDNLDAILILSYGVTIGYNNIIAQSSKELFYKLQINSIPAYLFHRRILVVDRQQNIIIRYQNDEPLSYFKGKDFLFKPLHPRIKAEYLYAMSNRPIGDNSSFVPLIYFTEELQDKLSKNPLLHLDDDKFYFIEETHI